MRILSHLYRTLVFTLFWGSVFIYSERFVNASTTPKFYFGVVLVLVILMATAINSKLFSTKLKLNRKNLWGVYSIVILLAFYGICQFIGWLPSNHAKFAITGSFDNPAGFATVLAMGFPIGLFF